MALFEQQGYDATSVEDIVVAANVSPSTVFRYFITKEEIVLTDEPKMVYGACPPNWRMDR
ncbi:helix-turn-helix transcriptional regulator [Salmonella enterica]|nr:TetR/AcrR family transcriptional regulator [Salmonella enterica]EBS5799332.1 TetR/AcrR family transcriptional regulator [Salmonella enterica subsp. enterica serovar Java]EDX3986946.1 helix-turn-helix transcriptional regulator [Salmonella enterica subsp. enterica serovar 4,[5],12:b:-]EEE5612342.1 TetR family transcriptional regulator [Salmonella enterica subsp. enterica serovar Typhimurium]EKN5803782.1 helix-turn-helix transcriptional regulator [Salmonella enterica subsp. enterica]